MKFVTRLVFVVLVVSVLASHSIIHSWLLNWHAVYPQHPAVNTRFLSPNNTSNTFKTSLSWLANLPISNRLQRSTFPLYATQLSSWIGAYTRLLLAVCQRQILTVIEQVNLVAELVRQYFLTRFLTQHALGLHPQPF